MSIDWRDDPQPFGDPPSDGSGDPARDPILGAALRRVLAEQDARAIDTSALATTIVAGARPALARLERGDAWWQWTARWGRAAIPIGLAAGIVGALLVLHIGLPADETQAAPRAPVVAFAAVALSAEPGLGMQLVDSLVGPATHDWLLTAAVEQ